MNFIKRFLSAMVVCSMIVGNVVSAENSEPDFEPLNLVIPYSQSDGDYADPNGTGLTFHYNSSSRYDRGVTYEKTRGGRQCRSTLMTCREGTNYHGCKDYYDWNCSKRLASKMEFKVDNSKFSADQREAVFTFDYYDDPEFFGSYFNADNRNIEFKYLGYSGGSTPTVKVVRITTTGDGNWKTAKIHLTDCQFNHASAANSSDEGFENGYDICIGMGGNRGGFASTYLTISPYVEEKPFEYTLSSLTAYGFSGQKYVTESFTPVVPELESGDSFQITSSDESAVAYDSQNNTVVVTRDSTEDKIVTVTLDVTKIEGDDVSKEFKLYVPSESVDALYEGFDYPEQKGESISQAEDWKFDNEVSDTSTTGLTAKVQPSPDDEGDLAMNLHVYRNYSKNQYPTFQGTADVKGDAIIQANFKFDETATNRYIWYIYGAEKTSSGETSTTLMQLIINRGNNQITCQSNGVDGVLVSSTALPTNEWVNLKIVIHSTENTFDMYQDTVKLNANPIQLANVVSGGTVTRISSMNFGGVRWDGNAGDMYLDDIVVRYNLANLFAVEASMLNIPSTLIYDYALPTTGIYDGTTISWSSDNEAVLSSTGVVNRNVGFGSTTVKLTATIESGDDSFDKDFYVDVVNAPYYTIDSLVFGTEGGDVSYSPVANGKIDSMYVTKYSTDTEDNATAYVTIYDAEDKLVSASKVSDVSETGEIELDITLPNKEGMYAKAFIWNSETIEPLAYGYSTKLSSDAKLYSIGDSTMQSYGTIKQRQSDNGMTGWAQLLPLAVNDDSIALENDAVAGTSTLSFYNLGYIYPVINNLKEGDYLLIQFGHNDEKPWMSQDAAKNYSPLEAAHQLHPKATEVPEWAAGRKTYEQWLRDYAALARMKGAQVIYATSIYRHHYDSETGALAYTHYGYPEAMIDTAAETGTPLLDLHARTGEWLTDLGEQNNSLKYFMAFHNGTDHTHLTYDGAVEVSNMALNELRRIGHPLQDAFTTVPKR